VVFVDWHGVLSRDPFWTSILHSDRHPLRVGLQAKLGDLFSQSASHDWMKGCVTSEEIIEQMALRLPERYGKDFLRRRLDDDCRKMRVNVPLFELLRIIREGEASVVIATDNMDCFKNAFEHVRTTRARSTEAAERLVHWARSCDAIICSSDVRALKAEDPARFFGPFLARWGLSFADAALIDDRADNCQAFQEQGGTALRYAMKTDDLGTIEGPLRAWLRGPSVRAAASSGHHQPN
jgi:FMN phosphatase YigB (HAD superfamily)